MTKKQDFNSEVGQVVQTTAFTQIASDHGRMLTTAERSELNKKVLRLEKDFDKPGWATWRFLHSTIGVENLKAMRIEHRDSAHTILDLMIELAETKEKQPLTPDETVLLEGYRKAPDDAKGALCTLSRLIHGQDA